MDVLERDDIARSHATPPEVKLAQTLEMMAAGLRLQREKLAREHPGATDEEIERMFRVWLERDD